MDCDVMSTNRIASDALDNGSILAPVSFGCPAQFHSTERGFLEMLGEPQGVTKLKSINGAAIQVDDPVKKAPIIGADIVCRGYLHAKERVTLDAYPATSARVISFMPRSQALDPVPVVVTDLASILYDILTRRTPVQDHQLGPNAFGGFGVAVQKGARNTSNRAASPSEYIVYIGTDGSLPIIDATEDLPFYAPRAFRRGGMVIFDETNGKSTELAQNLLDVCYEPDSTLEDTEQSWIFSDCYGAISQTFRGHGADHARSA